MSKRLRFLLCVISLHASFTLYGTAQDILPGDILASLLGEDEGPSIQKIDPQSGHRITLSGAGVGLGIDFQYPLDIAYSHAHGIYVADRDALAIYHVDPMTGNRSIVSGNGVGSGPVLQQTLKI